MATGEHEGAAVSILESPLPSEAHPTNSLYETQKVHGIARLVQVSTSPVLSLLDLTVRFPGYPGAIASGSTSSPTSTAPSASPAPATTEQKPEDKDSDSYTLYISKTGDLTNLHTPPYSISTPLHTLTTLTPDREGYADAFLELPIPVWQLVGRGMILERTGELKERLKALEDGRQGRLKVEEKVKGVIGGKGRLGILAGVIARSSGGESFVPFRAWCVQRI